jgi:hypothetical protein
MNTLSNHELMNLTGGIPLLLPPQLPSPAMIDDAFWTQRAIWEYLYGA